MPLHARGWYAVHRFLLWVFVGDNGYEPRIHDLGPVHTFLCARWVPHWEAYLARQRATIPPA